MIALLSSSMLDKNVMGYLSLVFVVLSGAPYIYSILQGKTKPHVFTHVVWALPTAIAAAAQYSGNAGPGAWAAGLSAIFCILTAVLSFSHGERTVTRSDWITFLTSLAIIPIWYFTARPLPAAILATAIDALAYYPTFRKSWIKPKEEMAFSYVISQFKHIASIFAMTEYSITTLAYPVVLLVVNGALIIMLIWRRQLQKTA